MFTAGVLTVSDKGSRGERVDESGQIIKEFLVSLGSGEVKYSIVPDDRSAISNRLREWADSGIDLVLTTGGTGLTPRDVTPEATLDVIDRAAPGFAEAMRAYGMKQTPQAMLSRAVAGICKKTLIINMPGSPRAVRECLEAISPALPHAIETVRGQASECARQGGRGK